MPPRPTTAASAPRRPSPVPFALRATAAAPVLPDTLQRAPHVARPHRAPGARALRELLRPGTALTRGIAALAVAVTLTSGAVAVAATATSQGSTAASRVLFVNDELNRTVRVGLGRAPLGGYYGVTAPDRASVRHGVGRVSSISPGRSFSATLEQAKATNVELYAAMSISRLPRRGSVYVDLVLRRQANGDALRAHARIAPGGPVLVGLSVVRNHVERALGGEALLRTRVVAGRAFNVGATVSGGQNATVGVRLWNRGRALPGWQRTVHATLPASLAGAGTVGTFTYVSARGQSTGMTLNRLHGYRRDPVRSPGHNPTPPPTPPTTPVTTPVTTPPTTPPTTPVTTPPTTPVTTPPTTPVTTPPTTPVTTPVTTPPTTPAPSSTAPGDPATSPVGTDPAPSEAPTTDAPTTSAPTSTAPTSTAPTSPAPSSPAPSDPTTTPVPSDPPPSGETTTPAPPTTTTPAPPTTTPPTTTAPGPPAAAAPGSAALGDTSYPVPAGAVVVAPTGSDSAAGTVAAPLRTLGAAVNRAPSGGTVVLRAGSYHESVSGPSAKRLTIQSYPGEAVWLDGSSVVSGWTRSGSTFVHDGWTPEFSSAMNSSFINPAYPMANHPDQVWVDGVELTQVASADAVTATSFYVDYAADRLVIGVDPTGRSVRASDLSTALTLKANDSVVRGIGVRRYANSLNDLGALRLYGTGELAENVIVSDNAITGVVVAQTGSTLRHITTERNGMLGVVANYADGITVDGVLARNNNTEHFNRAPVSGGVKITRTRGVQVRDSVFTANDGPGLWLDESCYQVKVTGNRMTDNLGHGASFEISDTAVFANNVVTNNGGSGFKINDSGNVKIWNNTFGGNQRTVYLAQDLRRGWRASDPGHDPRQAQPDATMPWLVRNIVIANNILMTPSSGGWNVTAVDGSSEFSAADMKITVDGNRFVRSSDTTMFVWTPTAGKTTTYTSTAQYTTMTGDGRSNAEAPGNTYASSMSDSNALPLPADVAAEIGRPTGTRHIGAF